VTGPLEVHPVRASTLVVEAWRPPDGGGVRWDHTEEQPDRDARTTPVRPGPRPPVIGDLGAANTVLTNGARLYVDHAHPEYATPECRTARDLVVWDVAGERIMEEAGRRAESVLPPGAVMHLHKNNTDGKGAAYGTHENYLVRRDLPFGLLTRQLLPMFVSRIVLTGAGRIGADAEPEVGFQISQRADFFEAEVGLETTVRRPLMNTRDEPHADAERWRRLHVINGDANLCEVANLVKVGAMLLVLRAASIGALPAPVELADPLRAFRTVSRDLTLRMPLPLAGGGALTALDLQERYLDACRAMVEREGEVPGDGPVLARWEALLAAARRDPAELAGHVDWATKLALLRAFRSRHGLAETHDRVRMLDLQYHDVRRDRGLHHRLAAAGRVVRLTTDEEVTAAVTDPPSDTRAWLRGRCIARFPRAVVAAGWDSLVLDTGGESLVRLALPDPGRGTRAEVGELVEAAEDAADLLERLGGPRDLPGQLA
jgi:proteasome accessory factor PafA2